MSVKEILLTQISFFFTLFVITVNGFNRRFQCHCKAVSFHFDHREGLENSMGTNKHFM
ncbi:hypothetical protein SDC9_195499 [bioreactor metagenome]|uniref:Uncharacterized protein n=1 Tax=bioreactor metagenome TaxID=1076179 RepID=A0A645I974_9ZZZZ